jgi:hypothetical protein
VKTRNFWLFAVTLSHREVRKKIKNAKTVFTPAAGQVFVAGSFRVSNQQRQEIFKVSMHETLRRIAGTPIKVKIRDASSKEFYLGNYAYLKELVGQNLDYGAESLNLNAAYKELLESSDEKYFCMAFDDQPIFGLTPEFLSAATALLEDFAGLVNVVPIEQINKFNIDNSSKQIILKPNTLDFQMNGIKPLGTVRYGNYSFVILNNFHYGFFFNTLIAPSKDYAARLNWYMNSVSQDKPHRIEKAAMYYRGPVYKYIAVPLEVFMLNIDFLHTEISVRGTSGEEKQLFEALNSGYQLTSI